MRLEGMVRWTAVVSALVFVPACGDDSSGTDIADAVDLVDVAEDAVGEDAADAADAEDDAGVDGDADGRADADADADRDADADGGGGTWADPTSGLLWQDPADATERTWDEAVAYCDTLELGGASDWWLPTISELRSFIRGCPDTMTSGACGVTDTCLDSGCFTPDCWCSSGGGPGTGGCYWSLGVSDTCSLYDGTWYWSSSPYAGPPPSAWSVSFADGMVYGYDKTRTGYARCVRRGP